MVPFVQEMSNAVFQIASLNLFFRPNCVNLPPVVKGLKPKKFKKVEMHLMIHMKLHMWHWMKYILINIRVESISSLVRSATKNYNWNIIEKTQCLNI